MTIGERWCRLLAMRLELTPPHTHIGALIDGQIWTFQDQLVEIRKVGKHLVQISRTKQPPPGYTGKKRRVSAQYESVRGVLEMLNAHHAHLEPPVAKPAVVAV
jgi:hypothetical protein